MLYAINRKGVKTLVCIVKVKDLELHKCSSKFLNLDLEENDEVFVKCDENGKFVLHGGYYSIYKITDYS